MRDYFDILGVAPDAGADEIKRAHRQLTRRYHPDITGEEISISVAGLVFGQEAAQGRIVHQIDGLLGTDGAKAVEDMLENARKPATGTLATLAGFVTLEHSFVADHRAAFIALLAFNLTPQAVCLLRFRRPTCLHLYSSKVMGYAQGFFVLGYYLAGYTAWSFHLMVAVSLLAYTEALIVIVLLPRLRANVRGLYWILSGAGQDA